MPPITFQVLDARVRDRLPNPESGGFSSFKCHVQLFGVTETGETVCAFLMGYSPRCYLRAPPHMHASVARDVAPLLGKWLASMKAAPASMRVVERLPLLNFQGGKRVPFFELDLPSASHRYKLKSALATGNLVPGVCASSAELELCESDLDQGLRQFHRANTLPCGWVRITAAVDTPAEDKLSYCDVEVIAHYAHVEPVADRHDNAPFSILGYDIETYSADGSFPCAMRETDRVVAIGSALKRFGQEATHQRVDVVLPHTQNFTMGNNVHVVCWPTEKDMLIGWKRWTTEVAKADMRVAYNQWGFDDKYLDDRARLLGIGTDFASLSKLKYEDCPVKERQTGSKQKGDRCLAYADLPGNPSPHPM
jgi:DNA polymerase delta subunit 1